MTDSGFRSVRAECLSSNRAETLIPVAWLLLEGGFIPLRVGACGCCVYLSSNLNLLPRVLLWGSLVATVGCSSLSVLSRSDDEAVYQKRHKTLQCTSRCVTVDSRVFVAGLKCGRKGSKRDCSHSCSWRSFSTYHSRFGIFCLTMIL